MRDIKFRAWCKLDKVLYDWSRVKKEFTLEYFDDRSLVFQQYTGLKDKNGVEIYEGDIVLIDDDGDSYITMIVWCSEDNYPAFDLDFKYIPDEWHYDSNALSSIMNNDYETIEVIGSIYENQELLEEN